MNLGYAFPADAAEVSGGSKISMLGGDFDTIFGTAFPLLHPKLALVIRLDALPEESGQPHQLRIELRGPLNTIVIPPMTQAFTPEVNPDEPTAPVKFLIVVNMPPLVFETPGTYAFRISVDEREVGQFPLYLRQVSQQTVSNGQRGMTP